MTQPMEGVRVLEVATWGVAPIAATVLGDWGADVIKIEHPVTGDPVRGVFSRFREGSSAGPADATWHHVNRGKQSVGVDIATPDGQAIVRRLVASADVFITSFPTDKRKQFSIEVDDVRAINPKIIYGRVTALGPRGPESEKPGHDLNAYWGRSGAAHAAHVVSGSEYAPPQPVGAMGDYTTGLTLAGGLSAALFKRAQTGEPSVVDASLLGTGVWAMAYSIITETKYARPDRAGHHNMVNPVSNTFKTSDGRFIYLALVKSDRWWPDFCRHIERPDLIDDERFSSFDARKDHSEELIRLLDDVFAARTYEEWRAAFATLAGPWAPVQMAPELQQDVQALANEYVTDLDVGDGQHVKVVNVPVQFDESSPSLERAPEVGEHTEMVLLEAGLTWDELADYKERGVIT
jgi:crotonobetainyl-CoA:carnitine CoA-transferase CaiB-like acyl-CoA transferase